jgi:hypothetical protein
VALNLNKIILRIAIKTAHICLPGNTLCPPSRFPLVPLLFLTFLVLFSTSCASREALLRKEYQANPVITSHYWGTSWKSRPLWQRLGPAPLELIARINIENELYGFAERSVGVQPPPEYLTVLKAIQSRLPEPVRRLAEESIIGIFAVHGLGSSGYAEAVKDERGEEKYVFIVLDEGVLLSKKANEWATWKENSVFAPAAGENFRLSLRIESDDTDTVENAVRFILLHEMGHALGLASRVHPSWDDARPVELVRLPFPRLSWTMNKEGKIVSYFDDQFPERTFLKYYSFAKAPLAGEQMLTVYNHLRGHTNFPSLQSAINQWEDFAESFATYVHVVLDKRPWQATIASKGKTITIIDSCWQESRCMTKKAFMEKWFADPREYR